MQSLLRNSALKEAIFRVLMGKWPKNSETGNLSILNLSNGCIFIYDINWSVIKLSRTNIPENFVMI